VRLEALLPVVAVAMLAYGVLGFWSQGNQLGALLLRLWPTILQGMGLVLLGFGLRFLRWRLLLGATGQRPPLLIDARAWMGSFAFTATPGKTGETGQRSSGERERAQRRSRSSSGRQCRQSLEHACHGRADHLHAPDGRAAPENLPRDTGDYRFERPRLDREFVPLR
jgi:hypothetical protein